MQISIFTTIAAILSAVTVTAAPTTPKRQEVLGEYTTYSDTHCDDVIAHEIIQPASCKGLPSADSIEATFDNAQGYECESYPSVKDLELRFEGARRWSLILNFVQSVFTLTPIARTMPKSFR
jgi:hypothetical protein